MSRLSEFQIYSMIKQCTATADGLERRGRPNAAAMARRRARNYQDELKARLDGLLAAGKTIPEQLQGAR